MLKKIYIILAIACFLFLQNKAKAQTFLYESITVGTSTAQTGTSTLSASTYDSYRQVKAMYTVETNNVRFRKDGTAPTTTEGHLLYVGDVFTLIGITDIRNFKVIGTTGTSTIKVSYQWEP